MIIKVEKPKPGEIFYPSFQTGHSPVSMLLSLTAIGIMFYIGMKYLNDVDAIARAYANYSLFLAFIGFLGYIALDFIDDGRITIIPKKYTTTDYVRMLVLAMAMFIIIAFIQFFLTVTLRLALTMEDRILYFLFAAPCEELFFRGLIVGGLTRMKVKWFISVPISAVVFMIAHTATYIANPVMYASTLFCGFVLAAFYYRFRDIGANEFAHLFNNLRAVPNVLAVF